MNKLLDNNIWNYLNQCLQMSPDKKNVLLVKKEVHHQFQPKC